MKVGWINLHFIGLWYQAFICLFLSVGGSNIDTSLNKDEPHFGQDRSHIGTNTREDGKIGMVRQRRALTMAGTIWCGPGDSADGDWEALGTAREADSCCRQHDNCTTKVKALRRKYHYFNWRPYTINSCDCDYTFKDCLLAANTSTADRVGDWFFNRLDIACFELVYEHVCVDREWWGGCNRWGMDHVAHTTSAGPYVWWLKNRPTPNPDIDHFSESRPDSDNGNSNGDSLETVTSNGDELITEDDIEDKLELESNTSSSLETIPSGGTPDSSDNGLETSTSDTDNVDGLDTNGDDGESVTHMLNSLENVIKGGLNEETATQSVSEESTEMSNEIPNNVD